MKNHKKCDVSFWRFIHQMPAIILGLKYTAKWVFQSSFLFIFKLSVVIWFLDKIVSS